MTTGLRIHDEAIGELRAPSYLDHIDRIGEGLARDGALGLILIDASVLGRIERRFGLAAHRQAAEALRALVRETLRVDLGERDLLVAGPTDPDELAVLFLRPRRDDRFYRERLPELVERLAERLARDGQRIVHPYERETPEMPVGHATIFHHPGLGRERQVLSLFALGRRDAELAGAIARRDRHRLFLDLVLAEDLAILYEPIVNLTTREVLGYEALVRGPWKTELHSPGRLFQLASETGLAFELDCLCRRMALRGARGLEPGRKLFLNCLSTAIHDPSLRPDALQRVLEEHGLRPEDLVFEISERESMERFALFREARDRYRELGFQIALDDTGVAYASLEAVMELAPDYIKVDLSLIRDIDGDPPRQALIQALGAVAAKLGSQVIAEGIETAEELATLQALGVPYGQGHLFGRAAPLRRAR